MSDPTPPSGKDPAPDPGFYETTRPSGPHVLDQDQFANLSADEASRLATAFGNSEAIGLVDPDSRSIERLHSLLEIQRSHVDPGESPIYGVRSVEDAGYATFLAPPSTLVGAVSESSPPVDDPDRRPGSPDWETTGFKEWSEWPSVPVHGRPKRVNGDGTAEPRLTTLIAGTPNVRTMSLSQNEGIIDATCQGAIPSGSNHYTVTTRTYSCFSKHEDAYYFYVVVSGVWKSDALYTTYAQYEGPGTGRLKCVGYYATEYAFQATPVESVDLIQSSPHTTTGEKTVESSITYSVGGEVSFDGGSVSAGVEIGESTTVQIPDVTVRDLSGGPEGAVAWKFIMAPSTPGSIGMCESCFLSSPPLISHSTFQPEMQWLWRVDGAAAKVAGSFSVKYALAVDARFDQLGRSQGIVWGGCSQPHNVRELNWGRPQEWTEKYPLPPTT